MGCHFLLHEIFPTQGRNENLLSPALAGRALYTSATREALDNLVRNLMENMPKDRRKISKKKCEKFWLITPVLRECLLPDGSSLVAQMVKNLPAVQETWVHPWVRKIPWRRQWQLTPVFLPGKSHGQWSLVGYRPWGHTDTTEWLTLSLFFHLLLPHRWNRNTFL